MDVPTDPPAGAAAGRPRPTVAVVGLCGRVMRYAEVERQPASAGQPGRLHRLGTCEFEEDVARAVLATDGPPLLDVVAEALADVFEGSEADALIVAAHPTGTVSFFSPLPEGLGPEARYAQLRQEAALLADVPAGQPVRIRAVPVRSETLGGVPHRWHHVLHVAEPVHARLTLLAQALGVPAYDLADTTRAASAVVHALAAKDGGLGDGPGASEARPALTLAVGAYAEHTEYALSQNGTWLYGHHGPSAAPEDTAYFALALLERLGIEPARVDRLLAYGEAIGPERLGPLAGWLGREAAPLDPLALFSRRPDGVSAETLSAFAPVLGAALR